MKCSYEQNFPNSIQLKHRGHIVVFVMSSGVETSLDFNR